jgi:hypothetical protein
MAMLSRLNSLAQPSIEPTLIPSEIDAILDRNKRGSRWVTATVLVEGDVVFPTVRNGHRYLVVTGGTTTTEPTWPTGMQSSVTAGAEFEEAGIDYASVYDLRSALRECWELKAAKASELISSTDSGSEQMIFQHCQEMVTKYSTPMVA